MHPAGNVKAALSVQAEALITQLQTGAKLVQGGTVLPMETHIQASQRVAVIVRKLPSVRNLRPLYPYPATTGINGGYGGRMYRVTLCILEITMAHLPLLPLPIQPPLCLRGGIRTGR